MNDTPAPEPPRRPERPSAVDRLKVAVFGKPRDLRDTGLFHRLALIPFNSPWSLAGVPAASVPCGFVGGLPTGLALVGRPQEEATVLRAAHAYQQATDWHERQPA